MPANDDERRAAPAPQPEQLNLPVALPQFVPPAVGEIITSIDTNRTYTIGDVISNDGYFSTVYSCTDDWGNDLVAKVLTPRDDFETLRQRAIAEVMNLRLCRHPNITYIFDAFIYRETFYIISERCNESLRTLWNFDGYDGSYWIKPIARCVLQAVDFIHRLGMVHKDIHPGNVLSQSPRLDMGVGPRATGLTFKVADLGVSNYAAAIDPLFAAAIRPPEALDPQQFGPLDKRLDLYHCGLLFLQISHGRMIAFSDEERLAGRPREVALELPAPYSFAIEKALRRRVQFRTQSAAEFWRDLNSPAD